MFPWEDRRIIRLRRAHGAPHRSRTLERDVGLESGEETRSEAGEEEEPADP